MKKLVLYYFLFLLSLFSLLSSGVIDSQDGFQYLAVARSIYYKGEPTGPVPEYSTRENISMSVIIGKDGKPYSLTGLGYSLAYLPAVAITDVVYKMYGVSPAVHFPLENDWLIFFTASFTNSFFGAMLGVILFLYLLEVGLSKKQALFISLVGLFSTNLLVYAKHSFPHMMFAAFLLLSFYLVKIYFKTKKTAALFVSGASFGVAAITYSQTFVLAVIPLGVYILILSKLKFNLSSIKSPVKTILIFSLGLLPFILTYFWFENLRATATSNFGTAASTSASVSWLLKVPLGIIIEGIHGQLFSPGRSIFLYSPILLLLIIYWHKLKKNVFPELTALIILCVIYIVFHAAVYREGGLDQGITALWHGENSWGPRYLTPLVPFGILLIGRIYISLSKIAKYGIFFPLVLVGLYVQILGVTLPYQLKLHDLQEKFFLNGTEYKAVEYSNFLPRYNPILNMSKKGIMFGVNFPETFNHGIYNVRFYDGIDFPFPVGGERWRVIEGRGHIYIDNLRQNPVKKITLGLINHPISNSSSSAQLNFVLNGQVLKDQQVSLAVNERKIFHINLSPGLLKDRDNKFDINVEYKDKEISKNKAQILGLIAFLINDVPVNLESIDVPYVSPLGPVMTNVEYENWGGESQDPWKFWDIHTQTYERLPDFWWIRNLYYWDIPKGWIVALLLLNLLGLIAAGFKLKNLFK